jgi:hypothetical protein
MTRGEIVFPSLIFALVAGLLVLGNSVFEYSWTAFAFPLGAGLALCALCAVEIARLLKAGPVAAPAAPPPSDADDAPPAFSAASLAWTFALGVFLYGLGFVAGPAAYLLVCLRASGFSWRLATGVAVASLAVTWGLFIKLMGVLLPMAPLWLS